MNKSIILFFILFLLGTPGLFSQEKDTVYIVFDEQYKEMNRVQFTSQFGIGPSEKVKKSRSYRIEQMEETYPYDDTFVFTHYNQTKKGYEHSGMRSPAVLKEPKKFLEDKDFLDINFFRTTPYLEVCKTFEEEHSHEQDVLIFMADVAEMKNDSVVLREVTFSRPVKQ